MQTDPTSGKSRRPKRASQPRRESLIVERHCEPDDERNRYREGCGVCGWLDDQERPRVEARAEYDAHIAAMHPRLLAKRRPVDVVDPDFELPALPVRRLPLQEERARFEAMRQVLEAPLPASPGKPLALAEQIATAEEWARWPRLRAAFGHIQLLRELLYADTPTETEDERVRELVALVLYDALVPGREDMPDFVVQATIRQASPQRDARFDDIEQQLGEREPFLRVLARSSAFEHALRPFVDANAPADLAQLYLDASGNELLEALPPHLRSVAVRIAVGRQPKDIAAELGKTEKTIRRYEDELRARLGAKNRTEFVNRILSAS